MASASREASLPADSEKGQLLAASTKGGSADRNELDDSLSSDGESEAVMPHRSLRAKLATAGATAGAPADATANATGGAPAADGSPPPQLHLPSVNTFLPSNFGMVAAPPASADTASDKDAPPLAPPSRLASRAPVRRAPPPQASLLPCAMVCVWARGLAPAGRVRCRTLHSCTARPCNARGMSRMPCT